MKNIIRMEFHLGVCPFTFESLCDPVEVFYGGHCAVFCLSFVEPWLVLLDVINSCCSLLQTAACDKGTWEVNLRPCGLLDSLISCAAWRGKEISVRHNAWFYLIPCWLKLYVAQRDVVNKAQTRVWRVLRKRSVPKFRKLAVAVLAMCKNGCFFLQEER